MKYLLLIVLVAFAVLDRALAEGFRSLVSSLSWSADGRWIAAGSSGKRLFLWDSSGKRVGKWVAPGEPVTEVSFSPDSSYSVSDNIRALSVRADWLASGGEDGCLRVFQLPEGKLVYNSSPGYVCEGLALSEKAEILAYTDSSSRYLDNTSRVWRLQPGTASPGTEIRLVDGPLVESSIGAPAVSPDGQWVAFGWVGGDVALWKLEGDTARLAAHLQLKDDQRRPVLALSNKRLAVALSQRLVLIPLGSTAQVKVDLPDLSALQFDAQGNRLAALGPTGFLMLDAYTGNVQNRWACAALDMAMSPDGQKVVLSEDNQVVVRRTDSGEKLFKLSL